jgi:hypothetical protein
VRVRIWFRQRHHHGAAPAIPEDVPMMIDVVTLQPIVALLAGILILIVPRILNIIVALYLIFIGVVGLLPHFRYLLH